MRAAPVCVSSPRARTGYLPKTVRPFLGAGPHYGGSMSTISLRSGDAALLGAQAPDDEPVVAVAVLYRFNGRRARMSVHAPSCPVLPRHGDAVDSSGRWEVSLEPRATVDVLLDEAARDGVKRLLRCVRCGGTASAARA
ncbi:hypothetical protein GCM10020000_87240 [Streptomyces olivoverticillatus]